eukprot:TRINITY_DN3611_c0_g1_i6.p1 TRINITY_DN3611_c0_g1~~TRINITY_DN3611_c0_g1_i6.p1  ORF type:complete len:249 (-),score=97.22 TRINITY_DN3611_c0_g1_i6:16-654(-)
MGSELTLVTMLRASLLLLGLLAFSTAHLDSTSVLLIGLNQFEPLDLPDTEDDIISECQPTEPIPEYPIAEGKLFGPASTFINGMVMVCGGFDGVDNYGDCFGISPELGEWRRLAPMMKSVFRAGFAKFGNPEEEGEFFWVAGGTSNGVDAVSTSQIYDAGTFSWFPGPEMPVPLLLEPSPCPPTWRNTPLELTVPSLDGEPPLRVAALAGPS